MDKKKITVVISSAGMGTRLGFGKVKGAIELNGKPLILHQLELLKEFDDICIVVGYQANEIIEKVLKFRSDIRFVFNNEYKTTGTASSLTKALIGSREYILAIDGDLLVKPSDFLKFINEEEECIGGCVPNSEDPVYICTYTDKNHKVMAKQFSDEIGELEWTGLALIKNNNFISNTKHVYQMISSKLPLKTIKVETREIDTYRDYINASLWLKKNYNF